MSEELEQRYLYTVYPKKPIRNINETLPLLRVPSLYILLKKKYLNALKTELLFIVDSLMKVL